MKSSKAKQRSVSCHAFSSKFRRLGKSSSFDEKNWDDLDLSVFVGYLILGVSFFLRHIRGKFFF